MYQYLNIDLKPLPVPFISHLKFLTGLSECEQCGGVGRVQHHPRHRGLLPRHTQTSSPPLVPSHQVYHHKPVPT